MGTMRTCVESDDTQMKPWVVSSSGIPVFERELHTALEHVDAQIHELFTDGTTASRPSVWDEVGAIFRIDET
jgi:hypothetical protein